MKFKLRTKKNLINQVRVGPGPGPGPEKFERPGPGRVRVQKSFINRVRVRVRVQKFLDPTGSSVQVVAIGFLIMQVSYRKDFNLYY